MKLRRTLIPWIGAALAFATPVPAAAQCHQWASGYGVPGVDDYVLALATFDDGGGPALYIGGGFERAGAVDAVRVARWDGTAFTDVGSGMNEAVLALAGFDDGTGPALYAGGEFSNAGGAAAAAIARWNGSSWSAVGGGMESRVLALTVSKVGGTTALYAGGEFFTAGGGVVRYVARWDGTTWSSLGIGANSFVYALASFDDGLGGGHALYACGEFTSVDGVAANHIARWNGTSWSALGSGLNLPARALAVFDDGFGGGPALYAGGEFTSAGGGGGNRIAKWNGTSWSPLPPGLNDDVLALTVYDDLAGNGPRLVAGGLFTANGTQTTALSQVAAWNGSSWAPLANGIAHTTNGLGVNVLAAHDDGSGTRLYCGGSFTLADERIVANIAAYDGDSWSEVGSELGAGGVGKLEHAAIPLEPGATLYSASNRTVMRLDDTGWTRIGAPNTMFGFFNVPCLWDDGSAPGLFVGGFFDGINGDSISGIAKWNGTSWSQLGLGLSPVSAWVSCIESLSVAGGPELLYLGGKFASSGATVLNNVATWNGTSFQPLGAGVGGVSFPLMTAFATFDDGSGGGSDLYAGGDFTTAGGIPAQHIARWNGSAWSACGSGLNDSPLALATFDDGTGLALYAGGRFTSAGGVPVGRVARWNGTSWSALGAGMNEIVEALTVFDDGSGSGPALFAGGWFTTAGGTPAGQLAKWNGTSWSPVRSETPPPATDFVRSLIVVPDGLQGGADLLVGGLFSHFNGVASNGIARWIGCDALGTRYCFGDGLDPVVTADCPCSNFGDPGHGCANSNASLGGALLTATGTTTPNTVLFRCTSVPNNTLCTFFQTATSIPAGFVFGDGVRCVNTPLIRFGQQNSGQNGNVANSAEAAPLSAPYGFTRHYQCQYRNPAPAFCPPATFNMSNAYTISW